MDWMRKPNQQQGKYEYAWLKISRQNIFIIYIAQSLLLLQQHGI